MGLFSNDEPDYFYWRAMEIDYIALKTAVEECANAEEVIERAKELAELAHTGKAIVQSQKIVIGRP